MIKIKESEIYLVKMTHERAHMTHINSFNFSYSRGVTATE